MSKEYLESLKANKEIASNYYLKSITKTEQQKFLEKILVSYAMNPVQVADIACGAGTLSLHLSQLFPTAEFHLSDMNKDALELARNTCIGEQFFFYEDDIYSLTRLPAESFDAVFCWQTLSWIDEPEKALLRLLNLLKPGGRLFASSLFNLDHDVDVYAKVKDHTRAGDERLSYNTYSKLSVENWVGKMVKAVKFYPFNPECDFKYDGRGLGTYTLEVKGKRFQISGGLLLNWAILELEK